MTIATEAPARIRRSTLITAVVTAAASSVVPTTATAAPTLHEVTEPATRATPMLAPTPTITVQGRVTPPATHTAAAKRAQHTGPSEHALHVRHSQHRAHSLASTSGGQGHTSLTSATAVLSIARANLGIPYVWGGDSRAGFDCSGYTQYVLAGAGKNIPRTAEMQRRAARAVSEPRPGDLVFFGQPAHHVGIYAGHGMMYHAPRTGKDTRLSKIWTPNVSYGRF